MSFFVLQMTIASGGALTPTVTTTGTNRVNSIALELKAAMAGTPPPPGIRVLRMQDYVNYAINVSPWSEPFPSSGNLLVVMDSNGNITRPNTITDSSANGWVLQVPGSNSNVGSLSYAANALTSPTLVMHWPITPGGNANTTVTAFDITRADPVTPFVQAVTSAVGVSSPGTFAGNPVINPKRANGVVLVVCGDGIGPITALTAPSGAYYLSTNYPGEMDNDTIDNADGYAINYYGTNLSSQSYTWTLSSNYAQNDLTATAAEFATAP